MREFDYEKIYCSLLKPEIVNQMMQIREYKGRQLYFNKNKAIKDILKELKEKALIADLKTLYEKEVESNKSLKLKSLVLNKTELNSEEEKKIAGYRDIISKLKIERHMLKFDYLLDIYNELYKYNRRKQFYLEEEKEQISLISKKLTNMYNENIYNILLIIPVIILDFWNICKLREDTPRICSLIFVWFMYKLDYEIGEYVSIEKIIREQQNDYLLALKLSSVNWDKGSNDYSIFVKNFFNIIIQAYEKFFSDDNLIDIINGLSKSNRIIKLIERQKTDFTRVFIENECPDIKKVTVERTLNKLLKKNKISKIQGGKYTKYIYIGKEQNNDNRRIKK